MNDGAAPVRSEIPIACDWSALTTEQQERQRSLYRRLRENVREVRELDDGYAFRHSPDGDVLLAIAEFVRPNSEMGCRAATTPYTARISPPTSAHWSGLCSRIQPLTRHPPPI